MLINFFTKNFYVLRLLIIKSFRILISCLADHQNKKYF